MPPPSTAVAVTSVSAALTTHAATAVDPHARRVLRGKSGADGSGPFPHRHVTEQLLAALEDVVLRHRTVHDYERDAGIGTAMKAESLLEEVAHHLAVARSSMYRYCLGPVTEQPHSPTEQATPCS